MKLDVGRFALAATLTMGIVYVVCTIFVALWPEFAMTLLGWLMHLVNVDKFAGDVAITPAGFIGGLAQIVIYTYIAGYLFGWIHNKTMIGK